MPKIFLCCLMVLLMAVAALAQDLEKGVQAYKSGNYASAVAELEPLAQKGEAQAQFYMGVMHEKERGLPHDEKVAAEWYKKAAEQGFMKAQHNLALFHLHGVGVEQNANEGAKWMQKAAEQGFPLSQLHFARLLEYGAGVAQDMKESVKWYEKAADQGEASSWMALGNILGNGRGVATDTVRAYMWLDLALDQNLDGVASACVDLASRMTPEQIEQARKIKQEWITTHQKK